MHTQWLIPVRDKVNINKDKISIKHDCSFNFNSLQGFTEVEVNSGVYLPRYKMET